ncbi:flap endonuclease-1 [mine drainage metagenome]|uniref:Flap endonuclease-1 n=3 Tax=mine drainage metagenome TaxID=410659 RepID=T1BHT7_9ZZZZ
MNPGVGLPLRDLVSPREVGWAELSGKSLAVDGYNVVYQFLATIRQSDGTPFSDANGAVTSHLIGIFYRTVALLHEGVRTVWVFDGSPPELKAGTIRARIRAKERAQIAWEAARAAGDLETARSKAAQTSRLTRPMVEEAIELLSALGLATVQAPGEGEAEAARLAADGTVWATASEDYDTLLFGAPRLVRGLAARRGPSRELAAAHLIDRSELLASLDISPDELILIGILVGTDFNEGAAGIGPKRALKLVRQHLGFEATVQAAGLSLGESRSVLEIFRQPKVGHEPLPAAPPRHDDRVRSILVDRHGFSLERVDAALRRIPGGMGSIARRPALPRGRQRLLDSFGEGSP